MESFSIQNANLPNLKNFNGLQEIGDLRLNNIGLTNVNGLQNVQKISILYIQNNSNLQNLDGFKSLIEIEKNAILDNNDLRNLNGLSKVTKGLYRNETSEPFWALKLDNNRNLSDITGISNFSIPHQGRWINFESSNISVTSTPSKDSPFCINKIYKKWLVNSGDLNYALIKNTCEL